VGYYNQLRSVVVNRRDQVETSGQKPYVYDLDGFLVRRDGETFEYNALGQMVRAFQAGGHDVRYRYDAKKRLTVVEEKLKDIVVQYFYADITRPDRVTHTYDHVSGKTSEYFYENRGKLFAMRQDDEYFYIGLDVYDSPVLVMNSVGSVVRQVHYDPLGAQVSDSASDFQLVFGFKCGIVDPATNLVFFSERIYDPVVGRWTVPNYADMMKNARLFPESVGIANLYRSPWMQHNYQRTSDSSKLEL